MRIKLSDKTEAKIILLLLISFSVIIYPVQKSLFAGFKIRGFPSFEKKSLHHSEKLISPFTKPADIYRGTAANKKIISSEKNKKKSEDTCTAVSFEKISSAKDSLLSCGINKALLFRYSDALTDFEECLKLDPFNNRIQNYIENCRVLLDE